ncbi:hypothetical protein [Pedobacter heparinus]|uniref:Uncharacterized protein n=1 Tax=Pedobacter heparinus (strain ATCC 13125 / DSM 2366 / CIP 104194 / JCM 7457 / NBRC 12017 / NCIMB 9290 / NRRL B-14731 / HIM 762-3) TaxID=485917 RepID=C6XV96_PEDHD|nr:hypothetical protein [Pedobacter heparinus]ACU03962.1 conserved hypothetical protein [Pedobacter heparinus DSM 2366]
MLENLPIYIPIIFGLTTVLALLFFFWAIQKSNLQSVRQNSTKILIGLILWLAIQVVLTLQNVYSANIDFFPPTILLTEILPALFTIIGLFSTQRGLRFIDSLPLINLTYLNIVRVPVELVLFWLFLNKAVPELMTFEGRNFDILAGISAPIIAYFGLTKGKISREVILLWNFICLLLLINIVINAFLSAPSPIQKFAFEQPNIAILHFPFSWLPTFIVPIVLFGHLTSIRQLWKHKN